MAQIRFFAGEGFYVTKRDEVEGIILNTLIANLFSEIGIFQILVVVNNAAVNTGG